VCRSKHVEQLRNIGIINSTTRSHLVGYFYTILISASECWIWNRCSETPQSVCILEFLWRAAVWRVCRVEPEAFMTPLFSAANVREKGTREGQRFVKWDECGGSKETIAVENSIPCDQEAPPPPLLRNFHANGTHPYQYAVHSTWLPLLLQTASSAGRLELNDRLKLKTDACSGVNCCDATRRDATRRDHIRRPLYIESWYATLWCSNHSMR